jgi:transcriptional regulator with XRE-family HTH domain
MNELDEQQSAEVGKRLQELRKQHLRIRSQEQFASKIGVTRGAVANWEIGKGISRVNLHRVARLWGVSMVWLSTGRGNPMTKDEQIGAEIDEMIQAHQLSDYERRRFIDELRDFATVRLHRITGGVANVGPPEGRRDGGGEDQQH